MNTVIKIALVVVLLINASLAVALAPHKSPNDGREYKAYTLKNKLRVLLVSDQASTKAAAALDVNVGSGADPVNRQGLAHFLEHMLFLGTEKYPKSGEYQEFISAHGGGHNAYTSYDHTNYFFDIDAQHLEPALDRFAQFFTAPLFNAEFVGREINAVESEYRAKLKEDSRRSLDVFKSVINQNHPFAKLSVGNVQTLLNDSSLSPADVLQGGSEFDAKFTQLREELLRFYDAYYSAAQMTLVVVGPQSLKQLKRWVDQRFNRIPMGQHAKAVEKAQPLFVPGFLPKQVAILPEKDTRSLSITFPIPAVKEHYLSKPDQYLGNIIGHEGKGSLLSYLKAQGWAEGLSAGAGLEHESGATFNVSISLTEAGLQHQQEIVAALFQLVQQIRDTGIERWRQDEQKNILATAFRFQEQGRAISYASHLARILHDYPARDVLRGDYRLSRYKPALIKQLLAHLRPSNALFTTMAPGVKHQQQSHWYSTPYAVSEPSTSALFSWTNHEAIDELQLPSANPFIAENVKLLESEPGLNVEAPLNISRSSSKDRSSNDNGPLVTELWWSPEPRFAVPKAQLFFSIRSPLAGGTAENAALSEMLAVSVSDALNEYSYPALLAGINFQVRRHLHGLSIRVGGYSDKQGLLLSKIAEVLSLDGVTEQRVSDLHAEMLRRWGNDKKRLPYQQLFSALNSSLVSDVWSAEQKALALPTLTVAQLREYGKRFLSSAGLQVMAVGNVSQQQAHERAAILESVVACKQAKACSTAATQVRRLPDDRTIAEALSIDHGDSALIHYYQARDKTAVSRAKMAVTVQLLKAAYFQQLRTQQQLGYIVFATATPLLDVPGFSLIVQSPGNSVAQIAAANTGFLTQQQAETSSEQTANYQQNKAALLSELREKPKNLAEQAEYYWSDLALGYDNFSRRQELIAAVENLGFNEWKTFFEGSLQHGLMIWSQGDRELASPALAQLLSKGTALNIDTKAFTVGKHRQ